MTELLAFHRMSDADQRKASAEFRERMRTRRTVRHFSPEPAPIELIEDAVRCAASAPSGANQQPWRFVVVADPDVKRRIREGAEAEERENYERRFPDEWLRTLEPFETDGHKEHLEIAPYVIVVFRIDYGVEDSRRLKHY
ncbi:MAG: nitroreductase family protein, partial [Bryobacterales bacterium]|nr:nitroreductase family protein [Bryobacterales bacterium]